ncbi:hypothetical protein SEMRO_204_G085970.1 [Seminavis robusta]|uniref:Uncharacterized protein n=1 Tax=Seminavis robusta TaxID=568900 RepID=A0A9N8DKH3_9STRA|nr:hypothetical protein SEMRO_204_G085970.1 [Seminavis robusta]|eukprot:Sro204_g085970.1 n/a (351) ;mRNA; r:65465-66662
MNTSDQSDHDHQEQQEDSKSVSFADQESPAEDKPQSIWRTPGKNRKSNIDERVPDSNCNIVSDSSEDEDTPTLRVIQIDTIPYRLLHGESLYVQIQDLRTNAINNIPVAWAKNRHKILLANYVTKNYRYEEAPNKSIRSLIIWALDVTNPRRANMMHQTDTDAISTQEEYVHKIKAIYPVCCDLSDPTKSDLQVVIQHLTTKDDEWMSVKAAKLVYTHILAKYVTDNYLYHEASTPLMKDLILWAIGQTKQDHITSSVRNNNMTTTKYYDPWTAAKLFAKLSKTKDDIYSDMYTDSGADTCSIGGKAWIIDTPSGRTVNVAGWDEGAMKPSLMINQENMVALPMLGNKDM